jgi:hypothetical protein
MSPTLADCLEHVQKCELCGAKTNNEQDRQFLLESAEQWKKLAAVKELEIRVSARTAA